VNRPAAYREAAILGALFLVALNLRPALASLGPVLESLRAELSLSYGAVGLLTALPVICMGVFAPLAMPLSARFGLRQTILLSCLLIGLATALRVQPGFPELLLSAAGAGAGIALLGPLLTTYIKQTFTSRSARVSSWVTAALCLGAGLAAGSSQVLSHWLGWPLALASWSMLAFIAAAIGWRVIPPTFNAAPGRSSALPWRQGRAWLLMLGFGFHGLVFYALLAWLAPAYIGYGFSAASAGQLLGLFALMQIVGTLLVSAAPATQRDRRPAILLSGGVTVACLIALWQAPTAAPVLLMCLLGASTAGLFALTLILPLDFSESAEEAGAWTAMMSGGGYVIAAAGPVLAGWVRDRSAGYASVFMMLCGFSVLALLCCLLLTPIRSRSVTDHAL
jgi:MFS transporter, CP family, cyanate transporter